METEFKQIYDGIRELFFDARDNEFAPEDATKKQQLTEFDRRLGQFRIMMPHQLQYHDKVQECEKLLDLTFEYMDNNSKKQQNLNTARTVKDKTRKNLDSSDTNHKSHQISTDSQQASMPILNHLQSGSIVLPLEDEQIKSSACHEPSGDEQIQSSTFQDVVELVRDYEKVSDVDQVTPKELQARTDSSHDHSFSSGRESSDEPQALSILTEANLIFSGSSFSPQPEVTDRLTTFSGNLLDWQTYYSMLSEQVLQRDITDSEKYRLILSTLPDEAKTLISSISFSDPYCIDKMMRILINRYDISTFPSEDSLESQIAQMPLVDAENCKTLEKALDLAFRIANEVIDMRKKETLFMQMLNKCSATYRTSIRSVDSLIDRIKRDIRIALEKPSQQETTGSVNKITLQEQSFSLGLQHLECGICEAMYKPSNHAQKGCPIAEQILRSICLDDGEQSETTSVASGTNVIKLDQKSVINLEEEEDDDDDDVSISTLIEKPTETVHAKTTDNLGPMPNVVQMLTKNAEHQVKNSKCNNQIDQELYSDMNHKVDPAQVSGTTRQTKLLEVDLLIKGKSFKLKSRFNPTTVDCMISRELLLQFMPKENFAVGEFTRICCRIGWIFGYVTFEVVSNLAHSQIVLSKHMLKDFSLTQVKRGHCIWMVQSFKQIESQSSDSELCNQGRHIAQSLSGFHQQTWNVKSMNSDVEKLPMQDMIEQNLLRNVSIGDVQLHSCIPIAINLKLGMPTPIDDNLLRVVNNQVLVNHFSLEDLNNRLDTWRLVGLQGTCCSLIVQVPNEHRFVIIPKY